MTRPLPALMPPETRRLFWIGYGLMCSQGHAPETAAEQAWRYALTALVRIESMMIGALDPFQAEHFAELGEGLWLQHKEGR